MHFKFSRVTTKFDSIKSISDVKNIGYVGVVRNTNDALFIPIQMYTCA
jgi:hypothetical protein